MCAVGVIYTDDKTWKVSIPRSLPECKTQWIVER